MNTILVSGSLAYDHIMDFPDLFRNHFVADKLHNINVSFNIQGHAEHFGGTAGNIAHTLALLGEKPSIIATAGNDFQRYETRLAASGVDLSLLHRDTDLPTSFAYILTDKEDNQISAFYPGAGGKAYGTSIQQAQLGIVAPSNPDDMRAFPQLMKAMQTPVFFDPGQAIPALSSDDLKNGIQNSEVVFGNDYEFSLIRKITGWSDTDLLENGKTFVITMGAKGTWILTSDGGYAIPGLKVENVVDPTGAGDAYRAGYAKGYLAKLSIDQCVKLGSCAAAYAVEVVGTQNHHFTIDEFRMRFEKGYGEKCPI